MGYATNSVVIPALIGKGGLIISDALNHASIVAGVRASGAKVKVFRHNDTRHLEDVLRASIAEGQPRSHRPWKKVRGGGPERWNKGGARGGGDEKILCNFPLSSHLMRVVSPLTFPPDFDHRRGHLQHGG